jgi:hypothetical protein
MSYSSNLSDKEPKTDTLPPAPGSQAMKDALNEQPAQVTPAKKKLADQHPEDVPPTGDMGPDEGPSS